MLIRAALLLASALAVAGIFQGAIFRIVAKRRRRRIHVERGRVEPAVSIEREQTLPSFTTPRQNSLKRATVEQIDPWDIEQGIRQLVRAMEHGAA
jgi:hypothetical protein